MRRHLLPVLAIIPALLLAACATAPLYAPEWADSAALPSAVAAAPERYQGARVIWGGSVIGVENLADHTEVELLAWPLDPAQRPRRDDVGAGRFIALLPGYVEALHYPAGAAVTLRGEIVGVRSARVGAAPYVFPLLQAEAAHVWAEDDAARRSNVHFNVGVGVGIR